MDHETFRKTEALIDLDAIRANYAMACKLAPKSKNVAVIKADAYGHGMLRVAEALQDVVPAFAVAILDEALELRKESISTPILVLEGVNSTDAIETAVANSLSLVVHSEEQVSLMQQARLSTPVSIWLKVDTGMHRLGLSPTQLVPVLERLRDCTCDISVVCTHLASADDKTSDVTRLQLEVFEACASGLGLQLSIANCGLQPAMTFRSEIIAIREIAVGEAVGYGGRWTATRPSKIGTVACGYADGYPRHAPNGTPTLVNGHVAPLVGTVSMDMITIDLTEHENVAVRDSVELWGTGLPVDTIASAAGTIGYELLTGVTSRVPRRYYNNSNLHK